MELIDDLTFKLNPGSSLNGKIPVIISMRTHRSRTQPSIVSCNTYGIMPGSNHGHLKSVNIQNLSHLKCTKLRVQIALVALFQLISALLNTRSVYVTITWLVRNKLKLNTGKIELLVLNASHCPCPSWAYGYGAIEILIIFIIIIIIIIIVIICN